MRSRVRPRAESGFRALSKDGGELLPLRMDARMKDLTGLTLIFMHSNANMFQG
jgi:hypothetical protein